MQCPKCEATMEEHSLSTLKGKVTVDRCSGCRGLWFDIGEAEALKEKWMSDYVDDGDPNVGKTHNLIRDINCPRKWRNSQTLCKGTLSTKRAVSTVCIQMQVSLPTTNMKH